MSGKLGKERIDELRVTCQDVTDQITLAKRELQAYIGHLSRALQLLRQIEEEVSK